MITLTDLKTLSKAKIWDSVNSRHIGYDRKFFNSLGLLHKKTVLIKRLTDSIVPQKIDQVTLTCSDGKKSSATLVLNKMLHMPEVEVNFISQG